MAELLSEDQECRSAVRLSLGETKNIAEQRWQQVSLTLISGSRSISTLENEDAFLCREPKDELAELISNLKLLCERKTDHVLIEPSEPSFELEFLRTKRGGIRVQAWLDAGNGTTGIYTWDAAGLRFATIDTLLGDFIAQLSKDL